MLVTFQNSEYQQEAAELAKTLVSDEIAMDYFENNGMPLSPRAWPRRTRSRTTLI